MEREREGHGLKGRGRRKKNGHTRREVPRVTAWAMADAGVATAKSVEAAPRHGRPRRLLFPSPSDPDSLARVVQSSRGQGDGARRKGRPDQSREVAEGE